MVLGKCLNRQFHTAVEVFGEGKMAKVRLPPNVGLRSGSSAPQSWTTMSDLGLTECRYHVIRILYERKLKLYQNCCLNSIQI